MQRLGNRTLSPKQEQIKAILQGKGYLSIQEIHDEFNHRFFNGIDGKGHIRSTLKRLLLKGYLISTKKHGTDELGIKRILLYYKWVNQ